MSIQVPNEGKLTEDQSDFLNQIEQNLGAYQNGAHNSTVKKSASEMQSMIARCRCGEVSYSETSTAWDAFGDLVHRQGGTE